MIFHRLRVISFSKSLLSIKDTSKKKADVKVDSKDITKVVEISMPKAAQNKQDLVEGRPTECINSANSSNSVDSLPVKPCLDKKTRSEPLGIFSKTMKKCTSRKTLSLGDLRRRFSLKDTLSSNKMKQRLQSYKKEKASKKKKKEIKVLYTAGTRSRKRRHYSTHLRKPDVCHSQNLFGFYKNQRLLDPYTFYQRYSNDNNPFQRFRTRTARRRKKLCEVSANCRHIHQPLKIIASCKMKGAQSNKRCFCTNPLHYNVLCFPSKSKLSKSQHSLRLYRSEGLVNESVRCSRSVKDKPCSAVKVSRGLMVSTSRLKGPVVCVDTAVSVCSGLKRKTSKPCRVQLPKPCTGHRECKRSTRKLPIASLYSKIYKKHLAFTLNSRSKHRSTIRTIVKYSLLGLVILMWSPCIFGAMVGWLMLYPLRFHHVISANNRKNYKCSEDCYYGQYQYDWWSNITSFTKHTLKGTKNVILSLLQIQSKNQNELRNMPYCHSHPCPKRSNISCYTRHPLKGIKNSIMSLLRQKSKEQTGSKNLPHCLSHPNPERRYTLCHADGRGWVIKPVRSTVRLPPKQNRFMQVFDKLFCDCNYSNVSQQTPCVRRRTNTTMYYARCSRKNNKMSMCSEQTIPPTPPKTDGSSRPCARPRETVCNPKEACITNHNSTGIETCQNAAGVKSVAEKLLDSICLALSKHVHEKSHVIPCTKSVCGRRLRNKRSRSAIGVCRADSELDQQNKGRIKKSNRKATECGPHTCQRSDHKNMTSPVRSQLVTKCGPLTCQPSDPQKMKNPVDSRSVSKMDDSLNKRSGSKKTEQCGPLTCQPSDPQKMARSRPVPKMDDCLAKRSGSKKTEQCGPLTCQPSDPQKMARSRPVPKMDDCLAKRSGSKKSERKAITECGPLTCRPSGPQNITNPVRGPAVSKKDDSLAKCCGCSNDPEPITKTERDLNTCECQQSDPQNILKSPARSRLVSNKNDSLDKRLMESPTKNIQASLPLPKPKIVPKRKDGSGPAPGSKRKDRTVPAPAPKHKSGKTPRSSKTGLGSKIFSKKKTKKFTFRQRFWNWLQGLCQTLKAGPVGKFSKELNETICHPKCDNLYLKTLRYRPCFWVYGLCPKNYPSFLKHYYCAKKCCNFCCGILSICFWTPVLCCWYVCFQLCLGACCSS